MSKMDDFTDNSGSTKAHTTWKTREMESPQDKVCSWLDYEIRYKGNSDRDM